MKINYPSGQLSQLSKISSNIDEISKLLCCQIYNDEEKSQRMKKRYVNCGVVMLCCDWTQYADIWVPFDHDGHIDICWKKCGKQKRHGAFEFSEALLLHITPVISQVMAFTRLLHPAVF